MRFPDVGGTRNGGTDSKTFIKMKSGDRVNGVFRGDPRIFRIHWVGSRSTECTGKDNCDLCKAGDKPKFRFKLNLISKLDGVWLARIFEGSYQTYKDLKALHESGYDLEQTAVMVKRDGEKTETKYSVLPLPKNGGLTEKDFRAIHSVPLNRLSEDEAAATPQEAAAGDFESPEADLPF